jgi:hypothetical protein
MMLQTIGHEKKIGRDLADHAIDNQIDPAILYFHAMAWKHPKRTEST